MLHAASERASNRFEYASRGVVNCSISLTTPFSTTVYSVRDTGYPSMYHQCALERKFMVISISYWKGWLCFPCSKNWFFCCLPFIPDSEGMKNDEERKRYLMDLLAERIKSSKKAKRQECKKTLEGMDNRLCGLFSTQLRDLQSLHRAVFK